MDDGPSPAPLPSMDAVQAWQCADVCIWLRQCGLAQYESLATEHQLTGRDLLDLTHDDLVSMGLHTFATRKELLRATARLRRRLSSVGDIAC